MCVAIICLIFCFAAFVDFGLESNEIRRFRRQTPSQRPTRLNSGVETEDITNVPRKHNTEPYPWALAQDLLNEYIESRPKIGAKGQEKKKEAIEAIEAIKELLKKMKELNDDFNRLSIPQLREYIDKMKKAEDFWHLGPVNVILRDNALRFNSMSEVGENTYNNLHQILVAHYSTYRNLKSPSPILKTVKRKLNELIGKRINCDFNDENIKVQFKSHAIKKRLIKDLNFNIDNNQLEADLIRGIEEVCRGKMSASQQNEVRENRHLKDLIAAYDQMVTGNVGIIPVNTLEGAAGRSLNELLTLTKHIIDCEGVCGDEVGEENDENSDTETFKRKRAYVKAMNAYLAYGLIDAANQQEIHGLPPTTAINQQIDISDNRADYITKLAELSAGELPNFKHLGVPETDLKSLLRGHQQTEAVIGMYNKKLENWINKKNGDNTILITDIVDSTLIRGECPNIKIHQGGKDGDPTTVVIPLKDTIDDEEITRALVVILYDTETELILIDPTFALWQEKKKDDPYDMATLRECVRKLLDKLGLDYGNTFLFRHLYTPQTQNPRESYNIAQSTFNNYFGSVGENHGGEIDDRDEEDRDEEDSEREENDDFFNFDEVDYATTSRQMSESLVGSEEDFEPVELQNREFLDVNSNQNQIYIDALRKVILLNGYIQSIKIKEAKSIPPPRRPAAIRPKLCLSGDEEEKVYNICGPEDRKISEPMDEDEKNNNEWTEEDKNEVFKLGVTVAWMKNCLRKNEGHILRLFVEEIRAYAKKELKVEITTNQLLYLSSGRLDSGKNAILTPKYVEENINKKLGECLKLVKFNKGRISKSDVKDAIEKTSRVLNKEGPNNKQFKSLLIETSSMPYATTTPMSAVDIINLQKDEKMSSKALSEEEVETLYKIYNSMLSGIDVFDFDNELNQGFINGENARYKEILTGEWLSNDDVNEYLKRLVVKRGCDKADLGKMLEITRMKHSTWRIAKFMSNCGLLESRRFIFPVYINHHFFLYLIVRKAPEEAEKNEYFIVRCFNSLTKRRKSDIDWSKELVKSILESSHPNIPVYFNEAEESVEQNNFKDCGAYTIYTASLLMCTGETPDLNKENSNRVQQSMPFIREQIVLSLLFDDETTAKPIRLLEHRQVDDFPDPLFDAAECARRFKMHADLLIAYTPRIENIIEESTLVNPSIIAVVDANDNTLNVQDPPEFNDEFEVPVYNNKIRDGRNKIIKAMEVENQFRVYKTINKMMDAFPVMKNKEAMGDSILPVHIKCFVESIVHLLSLFDEEELTTRCLEKIHIRYDSNNWRKLTTDRLIEFYLGRNKVPFDKITKNAIKPSDDKRSRYVSHIVVEFASLVDKYPTDPKTTPYDESEDLKSRIKSAVESIFETLIKVQKGSDKKRTTVWSKFLIDAGGKQREFDDKSWVTMTRALFVMRQLYLTDGIPLASKEIYYQETTLFAGDNFFTSAHDSDPMWNILSMWLGFKKDVLAAGAEYLIFALGNFKLLNRDDEVLHINTGFMYLNSVSLSNAKRIVFIDDRGREKENVADVRILFHENPFISTRLHNKVIKIPKFTKTSVIGFVFRGSPTYAVRSNLEKLILEYSGAQCYSIGDLNTAALIFAKNLQIGAQDDPDTCGLRDRINHILLLPSQTGNNNDDLVETQPYSGSAKKSSDQVEKHINKCKNDLSGLIKAYEEKMPDSSLLKELKLMKINVQNIQIEEHSAKAVKIAIRKIKELENIMEE